MLDIYKNGQASLIHRVKILNSSLTTGAGLTGLTSASTGLIISTIASNEATATAYTVTGSTIETITTLGTYAAPTATKCRFKEVDATNHPGLYELQFADARYAVANAKSLTVSLSGATNLAQTDFVVQLVTDDPYVAKPTNSNLLSIDANGRIDASKLAGQTITAAAGVTFPTSIASPTNITAATGIVLSAVTHTGAVIPTVTTLTNLPAITAGWLTAAGIAAGALDGKGNWGDATAANQSAIAGYIDTEIGSIKAVTDLLPNAGALTDLATAAALSTVSTAVVTTIPSLLPAALIGGRMDSTMTAIKGITDTADRLERGLKGNVLCTVGAASSATSIVTSACDPAGVNADQFKGKIVTFAKDTTTTALRGQSTDITASTAAALPVLTVSTMVASPISGDQFVIT